MQNGIIKLSDLFNGDRIFNIPKYQRAYTWREDNLDDFLEDLFNQRGSKSYFLGTLLFHQKVNRGEYELLDVVDGQQRLTTIILFLKITIDFLIKYGSEQVNNKTLRRYIHDEECYKIELENEDNSFFHNRILERTFTSEEEPVETPSQKRLVNALSHLEKKLLNIKMNRLEQAYGVLINADLIVHVVNKISDATQIFELLNDRGRKLTDLEGVKSFLMYRIGCIKIKDDGDQAVNEIQDDFAAIYRLIEQHSLNENDVLRYHTISFEPSKTEDYTAPAKYIKDKINKLFEKDEPNTKIKDYILQYTQRLRESFEIFCSITSNCMNSNSFDKLQMIGRVNPFIPQMMCLYKKDQKDLEIFLTHLVKFTLKSTLIGLRNKNESFYNAIRAKQDFVCQFEEVISDNWWNINKRADEAINYSNIYEWVSKNTIKYILFSYENWLRKKEGHHKLTKETYFSIDPREQLNIEHITAHKCANLKFDEDFKEQYINSIGNLVIDSKAPNSSKGKKGVDSKMDDYTGAPLMSQNEIKKSKTDWTQIEEVKKFIEKRNKKLISYIKEHLF